jgi:hypothetical protein
VSFAERLPRWMDSRRDGGIARAPDAGPDPTDRLDFLDRRQSLSWANLQPEKRLMLAVFEEALHVLESMRPSHWAPERTAVYYDAVEWLDGADLGLFSFTSICEHLQLDPDAVRAAIHKSLAQRRRWA